MRKTTSVGAVSRRLGKRFVRSIQFNKRFETSKGSPGFVVKDRDGEIVVKHLPSTPSAKFEPSYGSSGGYIMYEIESMRRKMASIETSLFLDAYADHLLADGLVVKRKDEELVVTKPENILEAIVTESR